jgi:hypothetical protein
MPPWTKAIDQHLEAFAGRGINERALVDVSKLIVNLRQITRKHLDE